MKTIQSRIQKIKELKQFKADNTDPEDHGTAISSGDYYMFEDENEDDGLGESVETIMDDYSEDNRSNEMMRLRKRTSLGRVRAFECLFRPSLTIQISVC